MFEVYRAPCSNWLIAILFFLLTLLPSGVYLHAQCAHGHAEIIEYVETASFVFSGEVISQYAEWDEAAEHIYTFNRVLVYSQLGNQLPKEVFVRTRGGKAGNQLEWLQPSLRLHIGEVGVFLTDQIDSQPDGHPILEGVAIEQSFLPKDPHSMQIVNPINGQFFNLTNWLPEMANLKEQEILEFKSFQNSIPNSKATVPVITNITPNAVPAGTFQTIFIQGSCFGDSPSGPATVQFLDPDFFGNVFGYLDIPPNHIVDWSDTEIEVIVPGRDVGTNFPGAGSGAIRVITANGDVVQSEEELAIPFNKMVYGFEELRLIDENGFGGYTFSYNDDYNNPNAIAAMERGVESWRCAIQSSFVLSGQSSSVSCAVKDGVNIISFDVDCSLPFGLLSQSTHWIEICDDQAFVREVDILFSEDFNWNYGPASTSAAEKDFETTIVHELGHAHGLGHVLNADGTMYPSIAFGFDNRSIDSASDVCGDIIMNESEQDLDCGEEEGVIQVPECDADCSLEVSAIVTSGCDSNAEVDVLISVADVNGSPSGFEIFVDGDQMGNPILYNPLGQTTTEIQLPADGSNYNIEVLDLADNSCDVDTDIQVPNCLCGLSVNVNQISNCNADGSVEYSIQIEDENGSDQGFQIFLDGELIESGINYDLDGSTNYQLQLNGSGSTQEIEIIDLMDDNCVASQEVDLPNCSCNLTFEVLDIGSCDGESFDIAIEVNVQNPGDNGFNVLLDNQFLDGPFDYAPGGSTIVIVSTVGDGNVHELQVYDLIDQSCEMEIDFEFPDCSCFLQSDLLSMECSNDGDVVVAIQLDHENNSGSFTYEINNSNELIPQDFSGGSDTDLELVLQGNESYTISFIDGNNESCESVLQFNAPDCSCDLNAQVSEFSDCNADGNVLVSIELQHSNNGDSFSYFVDESANLIQADYESGNSTEIQIELNAGIHTVEFIDDDDDNCQADIEFQTLTCMCDLELSYELLVDCTPDNTQAFELMVEIAQPVDEFNLYIDDQLSDDSPIQYDGNEGQQVVVVELLGTGNDYVIEVENIGLICSEQINIETSLCNFIPPCELEIDHELLQDCSTSNLLIYELIVDGGSLDSPACSVLLAGIEISNSPFTYDANGSFSFEYEFVGDGSVQIFEFQDLLDQDCLIAESIDLESCSCELSIDDFEVSDCEGSEVPVSFELSVLAGGQGGFSIFLNGNEIENDSYPEDGVWDFSYDLPGDQNQYEFEIIDNDDENCSASQIVETPNCTPCFLSMQLQVSDCDENGEVHVTATIQSDNSDSSEFDFLIDDVALIGSPFSYEVDGSTEIDFVVPGDGIAFEVAAVDTENELCADVDQLDIPFCELPLCSLDLDYELLGSCIDNQSTYEVTVTVIDPFSDGFNFFINGELSQQGPFDYGTNGVMEFEVELPAFGDEFVLAVSDQFQSDCYDEETVAVMDCDCELSMELQQLGNCDEDQMIPYQLIVVDENGEMGFEVLVDGEEVENSPFDYSINGTTEILIQLLGDGAEHDIEVVDLNNECETDLSFEIEECTTEMLCDLSVESELIEACSVSNIETYLIQISGGDISSDGLTVSLLGSEIEGSPFDFDENGNIEFEYSHVADGSLLVFIFIDLLDENCTITEIIELDECVCNVKINSLEITGCNNEGSLEVTLEITSSGASLSGFTIFVDGTQEGLVYDYDESGITFVTIPSGGSGEAHEVVVQDVDQEICFDSESFIDPNCLPCSLVLTAESGDCEGDKSEISCTVTSANGSEAGFFIFVDGVSLPSGPFPYNDSENTEFSFFWSAIGENLLLLIQDAGSDDCSSQVEVPMPDCGSTSCPSIIQATQISDCSDGSMIDYSIQITGGDINSSFTLLLNGSAVGNGLYEYDASGTSFVQLSFIGNGSVSELQLIDNNDPACNLSNSIELPNCLTNLDCELDVNVIALSDCTDGLSAIGATITSINGSSNGFSARLDGELLDDIYNYQPSGVTYIELPVAGDGAFHMLSILDMGDIDCQALDSVKVATCIEGECLLEVIDWLISDCEDDQLTLEVKVNSAFLTQGSFNVVINGTIVTDEPIQGSGERILSFELDCNVGTIQFELLPTGSTDNDCKVEVSISVDGELKIYPNPFTEADGLIHIEGIDPSDHGRPMVFEVYNAAGHLLFVSELEGEAIMEIDLGFRFAQGVYFFRLSSAENSYVKKTIALR